MEKEDINLNDIQRILIGDAPPVFLLEVLLRTLVVYTILLFIIRGLGKRMAGQLTITEMSVMIMLGGIVSVPMQMPDKGLLQGLMVLTGIILLQRGVTWLGFKYQRFDETITGTTGLLVKDGVMQITAMRQTRISRQQLFAQVRTRNIYNLGKIKRLYIEGCGLFSLYKQEREKPGLSVLPPSDDKITDILTKQPGVQACANCGQPVKQEATQWQCSICGINNWQPAVLQNIKNNESN